MKPIIKLNNGNPVILCNKCRVIIERKVFFDKIQQPYPTYCRKCDAEITLEYYNKEKWQT